MGEWTEETETDQLIVSQCLWDIIRAQNNALKQRELAPAML